MGVRGGGGRGGGDADGSKEILKKKFATKLLPPNVGLRYIVI